MPNQKEITAADAVKAFSKLNISVQEATPTKVKGNDGKMRDGFSTRAARLKESHVLSAVQFEGGRVVMTTIDGNKFDTAANSKPAQENAEA